MPTVVPSPLAAYAPPGAEVITVGSLSKTLWAGLRIGWVRATGDVTERLARYKALAPAVDGAFDLKQILQTSIGMRWSTIPDAQKQQLLTVFRAYTISNYAANFNSDSGDQIKLLPETRSIGADRVVETEIVPKSGDPTRMDYVMRNTGGAWKAVDVLEQGTISQAAVQRSDFRSLIAGGADKLIASLQAKVQTLSGGTINATQSGSP